MSCPDCEFARKYNRYHVYTWKNATVMIIGCARHVEEITEALTTTEIRDLIKAR